MFDALLADQVLIAEFGVRATCGHVVYAVECATRDAEILALQTAPTVVFCQMETSDDTVALVGFSSVERRKLYYALRAVSGIGRRSALAVLDCGEVIDTLRAAAGADASYFRDVPGLGKARIGAITAELQKRYKDALPRPLAVPVLDWVGARDALCLQGMDILTAERALHAAVESASALPRSPDALLALVTQT